MGCGSVELAYTGREDTVVNDILPYADNLPTSCYGDKVVVLEEGSKREAIKEDSSVFKNISTEIKDNKKWIVILGGFILLMYIINK